MSSETSTQAYLTTRVMSASPQELRLLLLDGAVKFARQGEEAIARQDHENAYLGVSRCRAIIFELLNTIREDVAPDLAANVKKVYGFLYNELIDIGASHDTARLARVIELIEFERETWRMAMDAAKSDSEGADDRAAHSLSVQA